MVKYQLLKDDNRNRLVMAVNDYLENGWRLYGDPFYAQSDDARVYGEFFCQAVTYGTYDEPSPQQTSQD